MSVFWSIVVVAAIVGTIALTVSLRRSMTSINEQPADMRRADEDTRPPFEGRGQGV
ncbi:hypothetical protein ABIE44_000729 [Marmoricola sp. OAE513]|uniref:hypothetical protein n=1 Tax=Marmoricola sp. OAE513 TaxID=2817894 RepID=UPI001AEB6081